MNAAAKKTGPRGRFGIYTRSILLVGIVLATATTAVTSWNIQDQRKVLIDVLEDRLVTLASHQAASIATALWDLNRSGANAVLRGLSQDPDFVSAQVRDDKGRVFAEVTIKTVPEELALRFTQEVVMDEPGRPKVIGSLTLTLSRERLIAAQHQAFVDAFVHGTILLAVMMVAISLVLQMVMKPLSQISHRMLAVAAGDLESPIPYTDRADEIGEVARAVEAFREASEERARAQNALKKAHDEMEQRVDQRTADLRIARDEAKTADRAKSEFLAAMSHELRTPLNAVIGFSEIIKEETFGPVGSVRYLDYANDIHGSGQHLLDLINDILDLSKVESGTDELHENRIQIPEIIRAALMLVGHRAEQGGVKIELELTDQLPTLRADERKLKQILVNLLSNAIKFNNAGGEVMFRAWCRTNSGYVLQIVDTGIGIAAEDIPKALSRFGQVDGDLNRQYGGTGLGLPLTKALVELHGGSLDLQSKVGVGTTVTVRFPAERIIGSLDNADSLDMEDRAAS